MGDEKLTIIASRCRSLRTLEVDGGGVRFDGELHDFDDDDDHDIDGLTAGGLQGILRGCGYARRTPAHECDGNSQQPLFSQSFLLASDD